MNGFIDFMESATGRTLRITVGVGLMVWGFAFSGHSAVGWTLGAVGILPFATGIWGGCLPELFRR